MSFRLVPKSVTLNCLQRHNSPNLCVISPNLVAFRTDYVKVVEDIAFSDISLSLMAIFAGDHPYRER